MAKKKKRGGKGRFRSKRAIQGQIGLGSLVKRAREDDRFRTDPASTESVIKDMPEKFQDNFKGVKNRGQMNEAQKAIFDFYNDGRSEFQRQIDRNRQSNPFFAQAYEQRFPGTALLQKLAPAAVGLMSGLPIGLGAAYDEARKLGSKTVGGLKDIAIDRGIIPRDNINPNTGTTSVKTDVLNPVAQSRIDPVLSDSIFTGVTPTDPQPDRIAFTGVAPTDPLTGSTMFTGETPGDPQPIPRFTGRTPTDPPAVQEILPTDPITEGLKSLFTGATPRDPRPVREQFSSTFQQPFDPPMIPGGNPRGEVQSARLGPLLGSDPNIAYGQEMNMLDVLAERARRGFNEGGLASINNPQYNMLMKASDFDI